MRRPCPRSVQEKPAAVTEVVDANPGALGTQYTRAFAHAKSALAGVVGWAPTDMVFVLNVTVGMKMIARGLRVLKPGDEILTTDQECGAVVKVWESFAPRRGCTFRRIVVPAGATPEGEAYTG